MPDPRWLGPPEAIAAIFEIGPGPASTVANQLVWMIETINSELSMGISAVNTAVTSEQWFGVGGAASAAAATGLNAALQTVVGWTTHKIAVTQSAAEAFAIALSSVIPSAVCQTNRDEWATANGTNFFGMRTPEIVALDTEYFGEHYPHNSSVGWTYSAALSALSAALAVPPPITPTGASPVAPAAVGEAVLSDAMGGSSEAAETAGQAAGSLGDPAGDMSSLLNEGPQLLSGAIQPATEVVQAPMKAAQAVSSLPQSMMGSLGSMGGMFASPPDAAAADAFAESVRSRPATAGDLGAGSVGVGGAAAGGGGTSGFPGAGLTSYTRPTNSFAPENAGRPAGRAGLLNATELRSLATSAPIGGPAMPMSHTAAGMSHRHPVKGVEDKVNHARVAVNGARQDHPQ